MKLLNLLDNRWVRKFINFMQKEDKFLSAVDLGFIDKLSEKSRSSKRGRRREYKLSEIFRLCMDGFRNGKTAATEIARFASEMVIKAKHELNGTISHDTISRFWIALQPIMKKIFQKLVRIARKIGIILPGLTQAFDGTDLPTRFKKDPDAKWNYDSTAKQFYFGYGTFISVDPATHLPIAGFITEAKKTTEQDVHELIDDVMIVPPLVMVGDPEFDAESYVKKGNGK